MATEAAKEEEDPVVVPVEVTQDTAAAVEEEEVDPLVVQAVGVVELPVQLALLEEVDPVAGLVLEGVGQVVGLVLEVVAQVVGHPVALPNEGSEVQLSPMSGPPIIIYSRNYNFSLILDEMAYSV